MQKIQNSAIVAGQFGIKKVATKEAEKVVVEKTIKTVVTTYNRNSCFKYCY